MKPALCTHRLPCAKEMSPCSEFPCIFGNISHHIVTSTSGTAWPAGLAPSRWELELSHGLGAGTRGPTESPASAVLRAWHIAVCEVSVHPHCTDGETEARTCRATRPRFHGPEAVGWGLDPGLCFSKALSILRAWPVRAGGDQAIPRPDQLGLRHIKCLCKIFLTRFMTEISIFCKSRETSVTSPMASLPASNGHPRASLGSSKLLSSPPWDALKQIPHVVAKRLSEGFAAAQETQVRSHLSLDPRRPSPVGLWRAFRSVGIKHSPRGRDPGLAAAL